ncbi:MAG: mercury resistance system periplasmic binding protein MerP [Moraxellaceae bacterium]|nr:mercury resistance system periplasmic binding protein MerP [Moraxellaceae bacterium]
MRRLILLLIALLTLPAWAGTPQTVVLSVQNMTCQLCPITVRKALEKVPGVSAATVDFQQKTATVSYDPDQTRPEILIRATTSAGYPATVQKPK